MTMEGASFIYSLDRSSCGLISVFRKGFLIENYKENLHWNLVALRDRCICRWNLFLSELHERSRAGDRK